MQDKLNFKYSLDVFACLLVMVGLGAVLYTFVIGKHYVIPTVLLALTTLAFNLAYFGMRDKVWAKYFLFWIGFLITMHTFFALFWAHRPRLILEEAFLPVYASVCIVFAFLTWKYKSANQLFQTSDDE